MQKSKKYLGKIISAVTEEEAVEILTQLSKELGIGQSYGKLLHLKERLDLHKLAFKEIEKSLEEESVPTSDFLKNLRQEAIHCYQELSDELTFDINRLKIAYGEDRKSEVRGEILVALNADEDFKATNKAKSLSALKEIYSVHDSYKEWLTCAAMSYGLWNDLRETLKYINFFIDLLASKVRNEQTIDRMDFK